MTIDIGQTVIHPHHGAVTIERKLERDFAGDQVEFFVLEAVDGLSVMVPVDQVEETGIRPCMPRGDVKGVVETLSDAPSPVKGHWSRRLKRNRERFRSGDPCEVAVVVRDLTAKEHGKGLSPAERRLLRDARRMLEGELAAVVKGGEEAAGELVDEALAEHVRADDEVAAAS